MAECINLIMKDITPWHGDVFDHPEYQPICRLTGEHIIPYVQCRNGRCENYEQIRGKRELKAM